MNGNHHAAPHSEPHGAIPKPRASFKPMKPRPYGSLKAVVAEAVKQAGGVDEVGRLLQRDPKTVYCYTDQRDPTNMNLDQAVLVTRYLKATAFAEYFAALAGGVFMPVTDDDPSLIAELGAEAQLLSGEFFSDVIRAIEDGVVTKEENAELRRRIDPLIQKLVAAQSNLIAAAERQPGKEDR